MVTPCFFGTRPDRMYAATYEITNICNFSCMHCMNRSCKDAAAGLPLETTKQLLTEMYDNGVRSLYLSGGEPLTYPDIDEILQFCHSKDFKLSLATNGSLVSEHMEAICDNVQDISISVDGIGDIHDSFRGMQGAFAFAEDAFRRLRGRVNIIVSTVIWGGNVDQLEALVDFVHGSGVSQINFSYLVPLGRAADPAIHVPIKDYPHVQDIVRRLTEQYASKGLKVLFRRSSRIGTNSLECAGGSMILHVTATGRVAPCSWCAKLGSEPDMLLTKQWEPGNMPECLEQIRHLTQLNLDNKAARGYTGCPAMAYLYQQSFSADDPLNNWFAKEAGDSDEI